MDAVLFIICLLCVAFCYMVGFYAARKDNEKEAVEFYRLGVEHEGVRRSYWYRFYRGEISYEEMSEATQYSFDIWKEGYKYKDIKKCLRGDNK